MRMYQVFLVLFLAAVAVSDAVLGLTADESSKLTSRGLDQEAGTDIDGDRMLRARDESADVTDEERSLKSNELLEKYLAISVKKNLGPAAAHLPINQGVPSVANHMNRDGEAISRMIFLRRPGTSQLRGTKPHKSAKVPPV